MTTTPPTARPRVTPHYPGQRLPLPVVTARPLVFVSVGTDHHPFERLVRWVDAWSLQRPDVEVVIQYGEAPPPAHAVASPYLSHTELVRHIARASVVVSHGGPATIAEAWRAGLIPLVAPRAHRLGEHVDDHQQAFAAVLAARHQVIRITTELELITALNRAIAEPQWVRRECDRNGDVDASVANFASIVTELTRKTSSRPRRAARRPSTRIGR